MAIRFANKACLLARNRVDAVIAICPKYGFRPFEAAIHEWTAGVGYTGGLGSTWGTYDVLFYFDSLGLSVWRYLGANATITVISGLAASSWQRIDGPSDQKPEGNVVYNGLHTCNYEPGSGFTFVAWNTGVIVSSAGSKYRYRRPGSGSPPSMAPETLPAETRDYWWESYSGPFGPQAYWRSGRWSRSAHLAGDVCKHVGSSAWYMCVADSELSADPSIDDVHWVLWSSGTAARYNEFPWNVKSSMAVGGGRRRFSRLKQMIEVRMRVGGRAGPYPEDGRTLGAYVRVISIDQISGGMRIESDTTAGVTLDVEFRDGFGGSRRSWPGSPQVRRFTPSEWFFPRMFSGNRTRTIIQTSSTQLVEQWIAIENGFGTDEGYSDPWHEPDEFESISAPRPGPISQWTWEAMEFTVTTDLVDEVSDFEVELNTLSLLGSTIVSGSGQVSVQYDSRGVKYGWPAAVVSIGASWGTQGWDSGLDGLSQPAFYGRKARFHMETSYKLKTNLGGVETESIAYPTGCGGPGEDFLLGPTPSASYKVTAPAE